MVLSLRGERTANGANKGVVNFGLTRGELLLVAWIFGLIYVAGLLPKIAARLGHRGNSGTIPTKRE
jgi:hypothetical protein